MIKFSTLMQILTLNRDVTKIQNFQKFTMADSYAPY